MEYIVNEVELRKKFKAEKEKEKLKVENKAETSEGKTEEKKVVILRTATDVQKRKIDKLMNDMSKEAYIPEPRKEWKPREPAEFIRDVMGSSAGAGSGEYHVYRNAKRRETKRLDYLDRKALRDDLDEEFISKIEENKIKADEATLKKREKRQRKKKKKLLSKKLKTDIVETNSDNEKEEDVSDDDDDDDKDDEAEEPHFVIRGE